MHDEQTGYCGNGGSEITLCNRKMTRDQFIEYVTFVPSGVAEITRLQQKEGYAYLKP